MLLPIKDCGKGVNKDLLPSELAPGFWSDALNVQFSNGFGRKRKGIQAVYTTPTAVPYFLMTFNKDESTRYLVQAGTATIFVDDGANRIDVTPASPPSGGVDDRWTGGVLNGVPFLNNGSDNPTYWDGNTANDFTALAAWTSGDRVKSLRAFGYYLVGLGYTPSGGSIKPYRVIWSDAAAPGSLPTTFVAADTNDAGDQDLVEAGILVDCLPLGDVNIIYGKEGRYAMQYIGGNQVFDFQLLPGKDGLLNRGCVVDTPKGHVFFTGKDVMIHSGGMAVSIAEGRIRDWLSTSVDSANAQRCFVTASPQRSEVWVCFPATGASSCNRAAVWNWNDDTWAIYSLPNVTCGTVGLVSSALSGGTNDGDTATIDSDVATNDQDEYTYNEPRLILATTSPAIGLANTGATDFGSSITAYRERIGIRPTDGLQKFFIRRSRLEFDGVAGTQATIYHGMSDAADVDPVYADSTTWTQGTTKWANKMTKRGLYPAIKIVEASDQLLALRTFTLDLREAGTE